MDHFSGVFIFLVVHMFIRIYGFHHGISPIDASLVCYRAEAFIVVISRISPATHVAISPLRFDPSKCIFSF
jgi:hypothetical protein